METLCLLLLPDETLLRIFDLLDIESLKNCYYVCHRWRVLADVALEKAAKVCCFGCNSKEEIDCLLSNHLARFNAHLVLVFCNHKSRHYSEQNMKARDSWSGVKSKSVNIFICHQSYLDLHLLRNEVILLPCTEDTSPAFMCYAHHLTGLRNVFESNELAPFGETKLVFFVENSRHTGRQSHVILKLRELYGKRICIVGCKSYRSIHCSSIGYGSNVFLGMTLAGKSTCKCLVLDNKQFCGSGETQLVKLGLGQLQPLPKGKHKLAMFLTAGLVDYTLVDLSELTRLFTSNISWTFHEAVYGCNYFSRDDPLFYLPGGRDYLRRNTTIMLLIAYD